jgi:hypothetical protein
VEFGAQEGEHGGDGQRTRDGDPGEEGLGGYCCDCSSLGQWGVEGMGGLSDSGIVWVGRCGGLVW